METKRYEVDGMILIVNGTLNVEKAGKVLDEILTNVIKRRQEKSKNEISKINIIK